MGINAFCNAYRVVEAGDEHPTMCTGLSMGTLISELGLKQIDLLKVDIEGAEVELFGSDSLDEWIGFVRAVMVELHEPFREGCVAAFENVRAISSSIYLSGEYHVAHLGD